MQTESLSLDTLKENLLSAVDSEYNVTEPETVLNIISQLETMKITRDQLHTTRLGREINNIRQKIDARKKSVQQTGNHPEMIIQIAQRAKKLLRSWQGLLTSQTENTLNSSVSSTPTAPISSSVASPPSNPSLAIPSPVTPSPATNGEITPNTMESMKPRLILKVKINPPITSNNETNDNPKTKRKRNTDVNGIAKKRLKASVDAPISSPLPPTPAPISPLPLIEPTTTLPRVKTTQQLLMEMQMNQPDVLSTQTPTVNAILQKQIIDESLHETGKVDYSALHHGREISSGTINPTYQKQISSTNLPTIISPTNSSLSSSSSSKRPAIVRRSSANLMTSNNNWENGSSAGGSPISPSSSSSSSITSATSWPLSTNIPEPPHSVPVIPKKKDRRKSLEQQQKQSQISDETEIPMESLNLEQSTPLTPDLASLCSSYETVADLTEAHRQRILAQHDARELEARPNLLLVPIDQLAFVYERERTKESHKTIKSKPASLTNVNQLDHPSGLIALPFIDCPLEFDLVLDDLVVQQPSMDA